MAKHNPETGKTFTGNMKGCEKMTEKELLDSVNLTVLAVEHDDSYSTKERLKIYSLLTSLSNCAEKERPKYAKKVSKLL